MASEPWARSIGAGGSAGSLASFAESRRDQEEHSSFIPSQSNEAATLEWQEDAIKESRAFLKNQRGYDLLDEVIDQIMDGGSSTATAAISSDLSQIRDNESGAIFARLASALTDVKPFWLFTSANSHWHLHADVLNKVSRWWWMTSGADMRFFNTAQYSLAGGTGYYYITWNPHEQNFEAQCLHPHDVLPLRPTNYDTLQSCEAVTFIFEKTTSFIESRWPESKGKFKGVRDGSVLSSGESVIMSKLRENSTMFGRYKLALEQVANKLLGPAVPVTDLRVSYVKDRTRAREDVLMGPWSSDEQNPMPMRTWSYRVRKGQLLYPRGRVIVSVPGLRLYDGPNNYWHGMVPAAKLTLDPRPFPRCYFGKGAMWDVLPYQRELDEVRRAIGDHIRKFCTPDVIVDRNTGLSDREIEQIDPRRPGMVFKRRPGPGPGVDIKYPDSLPGEVLNYPDVLIERMGSIAGTVDMTNVLRASQLPSDDTIDRLADLSTALTRARSRSAEIFVREVATMMAYNIPQFFSMRQILQIVGPQGVLPEFFDRARGSFIPDFVGQDMDEMGELTEEARSRGPRPEFDRAREFLRYFSFTPEPNSLLNSASLTEQLKYLQLWRAGLMDPWTLWEKLGIPNVGDAPLGASTVTKRMEAAMEAGMVGNVSSAGRKASAQESPQMKSSGAISESG